MANVEALVAMFEEAEQSGLEARDMAARCRDYRDGKQLTEAEIAELRKRGQPAIVINRIRRKIDWLRGLEMQSRTDPKAFPRTPKHEQGANAATDAIRFVCDQEDWDRKRSLVWESMLVEGIGAVEVIHDFRPPMSEPEIKINRYAYDRIFHDPHSMEDDFCDARYLGAVIWQDAEALKGQFPEKADEIDASIGAGGDITSDTYEDKPRWQVWSDPKRKRVRMVLVHYREGEAWKWAQFVKGGILASGDSEYVDEKGKSVCPFLMQSAYIDREGNRYGIIKDMLDPQDEINKRRSKLLHQLNNRQTQGIKGAVSVSTVKREMAKPDGHIEIDPSLAEAARDLGMPAFSIIQNQDQTAGQFNLLQEAKNEIDLMGANAGLAGKEQGQAGQSGRAIMAKQQGGLIEIAPLTDGLSDFTRRVYRHIWMRIRQFWRAEKWVRVTDDERNVRFAALNRPVTLRERLQQMPQQQVVAIAQQMGLTPADPRLEAPVEIENNVEELDVDILIEEVPDMVTLDIEMFQQLTQIATSMPGSVPPDVLIEMAPGLKRDVKDKLLERMKEAQQQQGRAQQQAAQAAGQAQQAELQKTMADAAYSQARAVETNVEAQRKAIFGA